MTTTVGLKLKTIMMLACLTVSNQWVYAQNKLTAYPEVKARMLAVGNYFNCVLDNANNTLCWGVNDRGQLGTGVRTEFEAKPRQVKLIPNDVFNIALGGAHACVVSVSKGVMCWGDNTFGQLGNGLPQEAIAPAVVKGLPADITLITAGSSHTCAVSPSEGMFCWGRNDEGQLGTAVPSWNPTPERVAHLPKDILDITAGAAHTCAISTSKGTFCWGSNRYHALNNDRISMSAEPMKIKNESSLVRFISNRDDLWQTCGVAERNQIQCWGTPREDMSQHLDMITRYSITDIGFGRHHACMIAGDTQNVVCWGDNSKGQLGIPLQK